MKRVVLTSSFAAIGYGGRSDPGRIYTEDDWTDTTGDVGAYIKSKTIAERAAWNFIASEGGPLELAVVNPVGILGPVLGPDVSTSIQIVKRLLAGDMPGLPDLSFSIVDVRDVADLHLRAMTDPAANGERFLAVAGDCMTMKQIGDVLRARMGDTAKKVPTRVLPNWVVRAVSLFDRSLKQITPDLGRHKNASHDKATRVLGWSPRSNDDAIVATAESLIQLNLLGKAK